MAGQYYDDESGLHYNWFRYYDPKIGRYLKADPIGLAGGINLYAYALNNPNYYIDPEGMVAQAVIAGIISGGIVGGINFITEFPKNGDVIKSLKSSVVAGATAGISVSLAASGMTFVATGLWTTGANAILQTVFIGELNIFNAIYNGFANTAGGYLLGSLVANPIIAGVSSGFALSGINLIGNVIFYDSGEPEELDPMACPR